LTRERERAMTDAMRSSLASCVLCAAVLCVGCPKDKGRASTSNATAAAPTSASASLSAGPSASTSASATGKAPPKDLNVLFITVDSLRADMPWAGYEKPIAPRLTALEKRAVSYTRAYAVSSYTSKSLGGLLAGKLPSELRRDGYFFATYPKENLFFPKLLQGAGIKTLSAQAHGYFKTAGFDQGFDSWQIVPNIKFYNTTDLNVTSPELEAIAEKQLGALPEDARFFAWYHFLDPHDQYVSHDKDGIPAGRTLRERYDGEVTFTDRYIGKLLDFVAERPWGKRTAIVVSSDHGEGFGEHGKFAHGFELWENLVRVPLFLVLPNARPRRIDARRSAIDLAPTFCELFGVKPDEAFEGKSLVPELYGAEPEPRDVVTDLPATSDNDRRRALYHDNLKLIAFGNDTAFQLFDLEKDPDEKSPITKGDDYQAMVSRYRALSKTIKEVPPYACRESCLNGAYNKKPDPKPETR
jgi:arylsulfatase A-like enzyme